MAAKDGVENISALFSQLGMDLTPGSQPLQSTAKTNSTVQGEKNAMGPGPTRKPADVPPSSIANIGQNTGAIPKSRQRQLNQRQRKLKPKYESSCGLCDKEDTARMVACDDCDGWFHFRCVGVNESISHREWKCQACQPKKPTDKGLPVQSRSGRSNRSNASALARLEEQRLLEIRILEKERLLQNERDEEERRMRELRDKEAVREREQRDKEYLEKLRKHEEKFMDSRLSLDSSMSSSSSISYAPTSTSSSVFQWLNKHQNEAKFKKNVEKGKNNPNLFSNKGAESQRNNKSDNLGGNRSTRIPTDLFSMNPFGRASSNHIPRNNSSFKADNTIHRANHTYNTSRFFNNSMPNSNHTHPELSLRNPLDLSFWRRPRDLPEFSGKAGQWPIFISAYTHSTVKYSLTDDDNLERLRKALKGKARDLVSARLISSTTVKSVIDTLYRNFGRPDIILDDLIDKVRSQPTVKFERLDQLMLLSAAVEDLCATLENSMLVDHLNNPILLKEIVMKLPTQFQIVWSFYTESLQDINLSTLNDWLISIANAASRVPGLHQKEESELKNRNRKVKRTNHHEEMIEETSSDESTTVNIHDVQKKTESICSICVDGTHFVERCDQFLQMSKRNRWDIVMKKNLCRTCLKKHQGRCSTNKRCEVDGCRRFHHALLHNPNGRLDANTTLATNQPTSSNSRADVQISHHRSIQSVIYRIIPVYLYGPTKRLKTFAFIDEGSSVTLMEEKVARELGLTGPHKDLCLKWTADMSRVEEDSMEVIVDISGTQETNQKYRLRSISTVKNLELPSQTLSTEMLAPYKYLDGIPIDTYENGRPTILIGLDQYKTAVPLQVKEGGWDEPIAAKTRLGWTIYGTRNKHKNDIRLNIHRCECQDLHAIVKEYFSLENFAMGPGKMLESKDDIRAKEIMASTTRYTGGRFETGLLWRFEQVKMPNSRDMALRRLVCFEKKLQKEPNLLAIVNDKIAEYIVKGYARKLTEREKAPGRNTWYLPIFTVRNQNKPTKVRLVWDAASKVGGVSLNDLLLKGPDNLKALPEILFRFRERQFAITGDIREMFHQVKIVKQDQDAQRFLWRNCDQEKDPDELVMCVMTFGATCSPSVAQYIKNMNADRFAKQFPRAVVAIQENHYVDDWLDSFDTAEETIRIASQVKKIHAAAGFEIRNWLSNDKSVLESVGDMEADVLKSFTCIKGSAGKVLGMWWNPVEDVLTFRINNQQINKAIFDGSKVPTKKQVLSAVMSIFDPLGLISTFLIHGKIVLQDIWRVGTEWDEKIGEEQFVKWQRWTNKLFEIEMLRIPRTYLRIIDPIVKPVYDLHVFVDAGEEAYAAAAYLRVHYQGAVECALISSKTRVSPTKPVSIPRLELLAAVLGVRLMNAVIKAHTIPFNSRTIWSDSSTVLSWLRSDSRRYKQFVAFRVAECLESTEINEWRYVPTKMNTADEATKWFPSSSSASSRWYVGPKFLWENQDDWPQNIGTYDGNRGTNLELRPHLSHSAYVKNILVTVDLKSLSTWARTVRAQAYVERAAFNFKAKRNNRRIGPLSSGEINRANVSLFKKAQWDSYKDEITLLNFNSEARLPKDSALLPFSPHLDDSGLLRMRGRIDKSTWSSFDTKRPIILPKLHQITYMLVKHYHKMYMHRNHETIINEIRQKFLIPGLRALYRTVRAECQKCKIDKSKPVPPQMGPLPTDRLQAFIRPFTNVGLDYFGPMEVAVGRRTEKRWGVLYTCLSVRAIHIEIVNSLSTNSCIRSLIMFMARRGMPRRIYSDNATTFHGAKNVLATELEKLNEDIMADKFTNIEWRFIPPRSPHFGGCWERLIRTVKTILHDVLPERKPNEEILRACLAEIEFIVNTRPLTHIPIDAEDDEALTPNHFIHGSSSGYKPLCEIDDLPSYGSWKISQSIADTFWRRFVKEYLPDLARRTKWYEAVDPLKPGDIVFVCEEKNERGSWPRGKIVDIQKGAGGQVRSAVVQTSSGLYTRPATKLAKIDVEPICQKSLDSLETIDKAGEC